MRRLSVQIPFEFFFVKLVLSTYLLLPRYTENAFLVSFDLVLFVVRCMLFNYQLVQLPLCDSGRCSTSQKNHLMTNIYYTPVTIPPCHVMIIHNDVVVVCLKIGLWNYLHLGTLFADYDVCHSMLKHTRVHTYQGTR